jgi:hypothetical protein
MNQHVGSNATPGRYHQRVDVHLDQAILARFGKVDKAPDTGDNSLDISSRFTSKTLQ